MPLVQKDDATGRRALHCPLFRPRSTRPELEVERMGREEAKALLDRLSFHLTQPRFQYLHAHRPGDVVAYAAALFLTFSPVSVCRVDSSELCCP